MSGGPHEESSPPESTPSPDAIGLARQVDDPVIAFDDSGTITFANGPAVDVFGFEPDALRGKAVEFLLSDPPGSDRPAPASTSELLDAISADGRDEVSVAVETADGDIRRVQLSPAEVSTGYLCTARPIENAVASGRLIEHLGDPMYVLDADERIQSVNESMCSVTGYDRDALAGRSIGEILGERTDTSRGDTDTGGGDSVIFETQLLTNDGDVLLTEAHVTPIPESDGGEGGSVGVLRDIRERKQRERDLALLKQILTRVFRHNVRNELTVVGSE